MAVNNPEDKVVNAVNQFTKTVHKFLSKDDKDNLFFSPLSIHAGLSLLFHTASGKTAEGLTKVLNVDEKTAAEGYSTLMKHIEDAQNMLIASKIFIPKSLEPKLEYIETAKKYLSEIEPLYFRDYSSIATAWVKEKTKEKLTNLCEEGIVTENASLVLANVNYFKGNWLEKFEKQSTSTEPFFVTENEETTCEMMHTTLKCKFKEDKDLNAKMIVLPCEEKHFEMVAVLPIVKHTLPEVEAKLFEMDLNELIDGVYETTIEVAIPKFRIENSFALKETLSELGLGDIFTPGKCDFSKMFTSDSPTHVDAFIQKTCIEVDEEGSEETEKKDIPDCSHPCFYANHPFLFFIGIFDGNISKIFFCGKVARLDSADLSK